jgi:hypothetical protein
LNQPESPLAERRLPTQREENIRARCISSEDTITKQFVSKNGKTGQAPLKFN